MHHKIDIVAKIIEQAESDRKKYGHKGLWIQNLGSVYKMDEVYAEGFSNHSMTVLFASISPIIPMNQVGADKVKEIETGIVQAKNKIIQAH